MIKNYIITAIRNISRFKLHSFINIGGLAVGISVFTLIMIYVVSELTYDKYHENYNEIYQLSINEELPTTAHTGYLLKEKLPGIKYLVRADHQYGGGDIAFLRQKESDNLVEFKNIIYAGPDIFKMFTIDVLAGDVDNALNDPYTIVLTESSALKLFGHTDILNKTIHFISGEGSQRHDLTITALIADPPMNSTLLYSGITSFITLNDIKPAGVPVDEDYYNWGYSTFIMLKDKVDVAEFTQKARSEFVNFVSDVYEIDPNGEEASGIMTELVPLGDVPFYMNNKLKFIYLIIIIGIVIITIAIINFINLSLAKSALRSKEIGLRKVVGASRKRLIRQFIGEAVIMAIFAVSISLIITEVIKPFFNAMVGKELTIGYIDNPHIFLVFIAGAIVIGIISGFYPAIVLSKFNPVKTIKNETVTGKSGTIFKQILSIFQISISLILIIGVVIISKQLNYMKTKEIGFDNTNLVYFRSNDFIDEKYDLFKERLLQNPNIKNVSRSGSEFGERMHITMTHEIHGERIQFQSIVADPDFVKTMGLSILKGRNFEWDKASDWGAMIVNEAAEKAFGKDTTIGLKMELLGGQQHVIGVYKDVHNESFHQKITPCVIMHYDIMLHRVIIKLSGNNRKQTIQHIESVWNEIIPDVPFTYDFLDDKYAKLYETEEKFGMVIKFSALFSIFIACLGLFGMISFNSETRKKEIGIRKSNGASAFSVLLLLNTDIIKWVGIATVIASPVAYFATNKWLENFAFRTEINLGVFVLAVLMVLSVALITVTYVVLKAARTNPAECLRYE